MSTVPCRRGSARHAWRMLTKRCLCWRHSVAGVSSKRPLDRKLSSDTSAVAKVAKCVRPLASLASGTSCPNPRNKSCRGTTPGLQAVRVELACVHLERRPQRGPGNRACGGQRHRVGAGGPYTCMIASLAIRPVYSPYTTLFASTSTTARLHIESHAEPCGLRCTKAD